MAKMFRRSSCASDSHIMSVRMSVPSRSTASGTFWSGVVATESGGEGALDEVGFARTVFELQGLGARGFGHLFPGFAEGVDHLVIVAFGGEGGELKFQEDEAQGVLEHADLGIGGKIFLEVQILYAPDGGVVIADFAE